jgi:hypothetical protein
MVRCSRKGWNVLVFVIGLAMLPPAGATETREIMHKVYAAIAYLLPLSVRGGDQASGWDKELIDKNLQALADASATLVKHAKGKDAEFRFLARSFDDTVKDIDKSFREQWPAFAYYSLMELTQHCVACHSRLPSQAQTEFGQRLMARMDTAQFEPLELAQLFVATRQFDAAMSTYEKKLMNPQEAAIDLDYGGVLLQYLDLAVAVEGDLARPREVLQRFAARPDSPLYLRRRIALWTDAMQKLAPKLKSPPQLAEARELFHTADGMTRAPNGRERAVHDLVAASILHRYVDQHPERTGADIAEAYYMLGVITLRTMEPKYSVPEMELLFAAAVRAAPKGPFAEESYALLEEYGYVHDVHLAAAGDKNLFIDMKGLRAMMAE